MNNGQVSPLAPKSIKAKTSSDIRCYSNEKSDAKFLETVSAQI